MKIEAAIAEGAKALAVTLDDAQLALLAAYVGLLNKWNKAYNLTAVRDPAQMVPLHILDSLAIAHFIDGGRLLDVGTGPGLPGIVLAIAQPQRQFTLLDSNIKKTRFVQQAVLELALPNVEVVHGRVEAYQPAQGFDTVTARAFAPLNRMLPQIAPHLAAEGCVLAMKSQRADEELEQVPNDWRLIETIELDVPGVEGARCALRLVKV